ncbi:hypothetical protein CR513_11612, partial [Mucuna pruriens]
MWSPKSVKEVRQLWTEECEAAFQNLRIMLATPPILTKPVEGIPILIYLSISNKPISEALVLEGVEIHYQKIEKAILALIIMAIRLRLYFHSNQVIVGTKLPIKQVLRKPYLPGRMVGWAVELSEFNIFFEKKMGI